MIARVIALSLLVADLVTDMDFITQRPSLQVCDPIGAKGE
jgi:hypothetical protein